MSGSVIVQYSENEVKSRMAVVFESGKTNRPVWQGTGTRDSRTLRNSKVTK